MKIYYLLLAVLIMASCASPERMYSNGVKKIEKAIAKDPSLWNEPQIRIDTIHKSKTVTLKEIETIYLPTQVDCDCPEEKSRKLLRQERKLNKQSLKFARRMYKDSLKNMESVYKLRVKQIEDSLSFVISINEELTKQLKIENRTARAISNDKLKSSKGGWIVRLLGRIWYIVLLIGIFIGIKVQKILKQ